MEIKINLFRSALFVWFVLFMVLYVEYRHSDGIVQVLGMSAICGLFLSFFVLIIATVFGESIPHQYAVNFIELISKPLHIRMHWEIYPDKYASEIEEEANAEDND